VAGGFPTAVAVAFAGAGRPILAVVFGFVGTVAAAVAGVACSPAGEAVAHGHAARRLLRVAAEESRRTDGAGLHGAVALLMAVHPVDSSSARLRLTDGDALDESPPQADRTCGRWSGTGALGVLGVHPPIA
jgi:hypothetical protein